MTKEQVANSDLVAYTKDWITGRHNRTYLTLKACNPRMRGDKSHQLYWDNNTNELVSVTGKGTCSYDFLAAVDALKEEINNA